MQCSPTNRVFARVFAPSAVSPFFSDLEKGIDAAWRKAFQENGEQTTGEYRPAATSFEDEHAFHIELDAPGITSEQVQVSVEGSQLEIAWERKAPEERPETWRSERRYGRFSRQFEFGETANLEQVEAKLEQGVLRIKVGKQPVPGRKQIQVQG
jgi:HSP20 family protein